MALSSTAPDRAPKDSPEGEGRVTCPSTTINHGAEKRPVACPPSSFLPHLPGRATIPNFIQRSEVTVSIHTLPESLVRIYHQFSFADQPVHWLTLQHARIVRVEVVEKATIEHKKAAVGGPFIHLG